MSVKNILVTGIGGNVGQGILRNIRSWNWDVTITGCDIAPFTAGNYLCDFFYQVPYAYDSLYIESIQNIVQERKIHLIIPSTDFEVYYLALNREKLNTIVAASGAETAFLYLDKYETFLHHKKNNIPFATAILPSQYDNNFTEIIVKPKKGRGSRGIHVNPPYVKNFSDEEYMVQELIKGKEITTAFYVTQSNHLLGSITLQRKLENGATSECKVVQQYDEKVNTILLQVIKHANIKGSANLQAIVTPDGDIVPFEVNCRISGTNSIRSHFGFEDVKYTVQELLLNEQLTSPIIKKGIAIRIMTDIIYPDIEDNKDCLTKSSPHLLF